MQSLDIATAAKKVEYYLLAPALNWKHRKNSSNAQATYNAGSREITLSITLYPGQIDWTRSVNGDPPTKGRMPCN